MNFLYSVAGLTIYNRVRSSIIWESLGVNPLWFGPYWLFPGRDVSGTGWRSQGNPRPTAYVISYSYFLGNVWGFQRRSWKSVVGDKVWADL